MRSLTQCCLSHQRPPSRFPAPQGRLLGTLDPDARNHPTTPLWYSVSQVNVTAGATEADGARAAPPPVKPRGHTDDPYGLEHIASVRVVDDTTEVLTAMTAPIRAATTNTLGGTGGSTATARGGTASSVKQRDETVPRPHSPGSTGAFTSLGGDLDILRCQLSSTVWAFACASTVHT